MFALLLPMKHRKRWKMVLFPKETCLKTPVFPKEIPKSSKLGLEVTFLRFRKRGVLWGFLETVSWPNFRLIPGVEDYLKLFWGSPKPPRNPGPSSAEPNSPPVLFPPAFDASPRGVWPPHSKPPPAGWASSQSPKGSSLNEDLFPSRFGFFLLI